jgi:peptidoglycan/LPS O-acetylase OafA/YrhL
MRLFTFATDPNRIYGLDIVRATAILSVVYVHGLFLLGEAVSPTARKFMGMFMPDGVTVFFVLSGYLISGILIRHVEHGTISGSGLGQFWVRRWCRTLPNYYLILGILAIYHAQVSGMDLAAIWRYFFFVQNFNIAHPPFFPEAWSLAVEEWFYVVVPILLFAGIRLGLSAQQTLKGVIFLVMVWSLGFRGYRYVCGDMPDIYAFDLEFRKQVVTRLDSLIWGVLGAVIHRYHANIWRWRPQLTFVTGITVLMTDTLLFTFRPELGLPLNAYFCVFSFSVGALGVLLTLPLLSSIKQGQGFVYRWITFFSITSYSMYLIHLSLVQFVLVPASMNMLPFHLTGLPLGLFKFSLYLVYNVVGAALLYKYVEVPTTALRRFAGKELAPAASRAQPLAGS